MLLVQMRIAMNARMAWSSDTVKLHAQVDEVKSDEVICTSRNSAQLDGLLTVFHTERSADSLQNIQNDLPILTDYDKEVIKAISKEIEIDFLSLSFVREGEDLVIAREFLDSIGATTTKV